MRLYRTLDIKSTNSFKNFAVFLVPMFLVLLADSVLSYAFPIIVAKELNSNFAMGIIMAISSLVGMTTDLLLPKYFKHGSWKKLLFWGIVSSFAFPIFTFFGTKSFAFINFVIATSVWGIYFEFLSFSQQDFVVSKKHSNADYSRDWGIISGIWYLNNLMGPILGASLLMAGIANFTSSLVIIIGFGLLTSLLLFTKKNTKTPKVSSPKKHLKSNVERSIEFIKEIGAISEISKVIYPLIMISFISTCVNAAFWTIGGLYGEQIETDVAPEWLVLGVFSFATLLSSVVLTLYPVRKNFRRFSELSLVASGIALCFLPFVDDLVAIYAVVFISTFFLGFVRPLNDTIFSQLSQRNFNNEMYFISISRMTISFAYVFCPLLIGLISDVFNHQVSFGVIGAIAAITGLYFLFTTEKDFRLPEKKILEIEEA